MFFNVPPKSVEKIEQIIFSETQLQPPVFADAVNGLSARIYTPRVRQSVVNGFSCENQNSTVLQGCRDALEEADVISAVMERFRRII